jgi:flagellar basal-body rod protein FlgF
MELFAITLTSLQQDMARLDQVATNLANVSTPAYKRQVLSVRPFTQALNEAAAQVPGVDEVTTARSTTEVLSDQRVGTARHTGRPLDLALLGEGHFEVLTDSGPAYTRKGDFTVDAQGRLVTSQGLAVMSKNGEIRLTGRTPVIDAAGNVTELVSPADGAPAMPLGQLKIMRFEKPQNLRRLGEGLFAQGEGMTVLPDGEVQLRQGALENANVSTTREMVDLIETMRHFESMQRVIQGYDEMIGSAVRKLAEV